MQGLKAQLAQAETKLSDISSIVGKNHPQRLQLDAQIAELKRQIAAETRRVAGGTSTLSRGSSQKVGELQTMVDQQKRQLLSLRSDRDQIAVYQRDVEAAQRAYDAVSMRLGQVNMEGQNNQANTRLLSPAVEPLEPSRPKIMVGIVGSILGALAVGILAALGLELLDRRIRRPEDLMVMPGVPVIGVLQPAGSRRPVFRRLLMIAPPLPIQAGAASPGDAVMKTAVSMLGTAARATRSLGAILIDGGQLTPEDAERILLYQKEHNLRFGEAAMRLGPDQRSRHPVRALAPVRLRLPAQEAGRAAAAQRRARRRLPAVQPAGRAAARHPQPAHAALVRPLPRNARC